MSTDVLAEYGLRRIINLAGIETAHGAAAVPPEIARAVHDILPHYVEMNELQSVASAEIAATTGAEAGFVTNCAAAGITVAVAATMTGLDPARIEQLPDTTGMKNRVVLQKGHEVNFGASVTQMIRLSGAAVVEIGTATSAALFQLRAALTPDVTAALYVVSHHTVQHGLIPLAEFCEVCHAAEVPVIVDAAAEYDWGALLAQGADIVVFSVQKALLGPTAGIVAGRRDLVQAAHHQEAGIGRPMKTGKEGIAGAIAALRRRRREEIGADAEPRLTRTEAALAAVPGLSTRRQRDPTGGPFSRLELHVDPSLTGRNAWSLAAELAGGSPKIALRTLHADLGYLLLDMRPVSDAELEEALAAIIGCCASSPAIDPARARQRRGDRMAAQYRGWPRSVRGAP
ncbi:aminotransferase class V-fold PLP-dependent enzyme [Ancylobacter terrae]|uniref:aminotransferase class V-fold PLP-dependent enzyme n=1 Tax=Ancylobacter sp. sgz301288 TaxID=3342077 RepID=UPI003859F640